ncbi:DUF2188 domain-containing protein [Breoghania sp. JC706]|uniref:DUF2188 domain-containing protein n=1 Tax=Breoghania sp. JC706 TaxID=3117732 RepID=UPI00300B042F
MKPIDIVHRDDGWAYVVAGRISQSFGTREDAVAAGKAAAEEQAVLDGELDEGLRGTFPASDPVSAVQRGHTGGDND